MLRYLVAASVLATSACNTFRPVSRIADVPPRAMVEISFDNPRDLWTNVGDRSYPLMVVTSVRGRLDAAVADTAVLSFVSAESIVELPSPPQGSTLRIGIGESTQVSQRQVSLATTALTLGGVGAFFGLLGLIGGDGGGGGTTVLSGPIGGG
jgi:hypothetical protein